MRFKVLGPLEIETDDGPLVVTGRRPRALLVALLRSHGSWCRPTAWSMRCGRSCGWAAWRIGSSCCSVGG
jgi:hypothetical protein